MWFKCCEGPDVLKYQFIVISWRAFPHTLHWICATFCEKGGINLSAMVDIGMTKDKWQSQIFLNQIYKHRPCQSRLITFKQISDAKHMQKHKWAVSSKIPQQNHTMKTQITNQPLESYTSTMSVLPKNHTINTKDDKIRAATINKEYWILYQSTNSWKISLLSLAQIKLHDQCINAIQNRQFFFWPWHTKYEVQQELHGNMTIVEGPNKKFPNIHNLQPSNEQVIKGEHKKKHHCQDLHQHQHQKGMPCHVEQHWQMFTRGTYTLTWIESSTCIQYKATSTCLSHMAMMYSRIDLSQHSMIYSPCSKK